MKIALTFIALFLTVAGSSLQAAAVRECPWGELRWDAGSSQHALAEYQMLEAPDWSFLGAGRMELTIVTWPKHESYRPLEVSGFCDLMEERFEFTGPDGNIQGRCLTSMYYEPGSQVGIIFHAERSDGSEWQFLHLRCNGPW